MRRIITMFFLIVTNFVIQTSLFEHIEIAGVKPNTALLIVVAYAILRGDVEGSIFGFFSGLLIDVFFGSIIGFHTLVFTLTGYFSGKPFKDFYPENYMIPLILATFFSFIYETSFFIVHYFLLTKSSFSFYFSKTIFPSVIYSLFLSVPIYFLVYVINNQVEKREKIERNIFEGKSKGK